MTQAQTDRQITRESSAYTAMVETAEFLELMETAVMYHHALLQFCKDKRIDASAAISAARTRYSRTLPPMKVV